MTAHVLEGFRPDKKPGAVLFNPRTGEAFGPVFGSGDEARNFLSFISDVDATALSWNGFLSDGEELVKMWVAAKKAPFRPVFQFDESFLVKNDGDRKHRWFMACSFGTVCFPLFLGFNNNEIRELLQKQRLPRVSIDSESSCLYFHFRTKAEGSNFLAHLNTWLERNWHRAYKAIRKKPRRKRAKT